MVSRTTSLPYPPKYTQTTLLLEGILDQNFAKICLREIRAKDG